MAYPVWYAGIMPKTKAFLPPIRLKASDIGPMLPVLAAAKSPAPSSQRPNRVPCEETWNVVEMSAPAEAGLLAENV